MTKRINPLFSNKEEKNLIVASEPIQANRNGTAVSPISGKPMQKVSCDGVEAWYDDTNRLVLPVMEN